MSAEIGLALQRSDGSLPPGHNGPYADPETPVRNTGHWLITWLFAERQTGEQKFRVAAERATDYLMSPEARPYGFSFHHRDKAGKDKCNGMMGPAFSLEALVEAARRFERQDIFDLAEQIVRLHVFNERQNLWHTREITGEVSIVDTTLNHQLWFAASVSAVNAIGGSAGRAEVETFLDRMSKTMALRPSGRIRHIARDPSRWVELKRTVREVRQGGAEKSRRRETAYHCFNLYPLAIMKKNVPNSLFWETRIFSNALAYPDSEAYRMTAEDPSFVDPYIPAGFPLAYSERALLCQIFNLSKTEEQSRLIKRQFSLTYNSETGLHDRNSVDPVTQAARMYEMTRLDDINLDTD